MKETTEQAKQRTRELVPECRSWLEFAEILHPLPGVAEAFECEGRLWLRFQRHATTEQRDRVTELLAGRRPQLRAHPERTPKRERRHQPQPQANHGGTAPHLAREFERLNREASGLIAEGWRLRRLAWDLYRDHRRRL